MVGTNVFGLGAFAESMVLPAVAALPVPAGWSDEQALGLVVNCPTALAALRPLGALAAGQTVLIHAAAGATGQAAVTMAKHYGATVIATASPEKHAALQAADHVLDSRSADIAGEVLRLTGGAGVDLVLESAGGTTFEAGLASAKRVTGRVAAHDVRPGRRSEGAGRTGGPRDRRQAGAAPVRTSAEEGRVRRDGQSTITRSLVVLFIRSPAVSPQMTMSSIRAPCRPGR